MTPIRLIILPATAEQPSRQILFGPDDRVIEDTALEYGGPWLDGAPVVLAVPGADVLMRRIALPTGSRAQAEAAALLAMEAETASAHEELIVAVGRPDLAGESLVAAASALRVRAWIEMARALGVEPEVVIPDYLLVPDDADQVRTLEFGDRTAVRGQGLAMAAEPSLLPLLLEGRMVLALTWSPERLAEIAATIRNPVLNLKPRPPVPRADRRALALGLALTIAVAVSPLLLEVARGWQDHRAANRDIAQATGLARSVLGSGTPIDDPAAQVRARRLELGSGAGFAASTAALFSAIESIEGARLEGLFYEPSGTLRATIAYPDYSAVDPLIRAAASRGLELEEVSALDQQGVRVGDFTGRPL